MNVNFYSNPVLLKSLKFVSENSIAFSAGATVAFSSIARPLSVLLTPKTDREDKKLSCVKSISSSISGFLFTLLFSSPFSKAIKNIDTNPKQYLKKETIEKFTKNGDITSSKQYRFLTQLFKLGLGVLLAYPKAMTNNAIIPKLVNKKEDKKNTPSFKGKIEKIVSSVIDNPIAQKIADKFKNTKFETHLMTLSDIFATAASITITNKNKNLKPRQKKVLNNNALISTSLCVGLGYSFDKLTDKPFLNFINNLKKANKNSKNLAKYVEGANIAKTSLIFALVYYCLIPPIATFFSSRLSKDDK